MTEQPREGVCAKCSQRRPLFQLSLNVWPWDENGSALVCVRCYDTAEQLMATQSQEDMGCWLPIREDGWDQFAPPSEHPQLDKAHALVGPIQSYDGRRIR